MNIPAQLTGDFLITPPRKPRYPGRDIVTNRRTAVDLRYKQLHGGTVRNPCERPYIMEGLGLPSGIVQEGQPMPFRTAGRCRRCSGCLRHRRAIWFARARAESFAAKRTWFGTLTFRPDDRFRVLLQAKGYLETRRAEPWQDIPEDARFAALARFAGEHVTLFLKRLRAEGFKVRYLVVCEKHKDGFPHYHLLLHEYGDNVAKRILEAQWRYGFSHWRLVEHDSKAINYCVKYLSKAVETRIRASSRYGQKGAAVCLADRLGAIAQNYGSAVRSTPDEDRSPTQATTNVVAPQVKGSSQTG